MLKDFVLVGTGSFFGGGLRYLVARWVQLFPAMNFPLATFIVNVLGCFIIGVLYGLKWDTALMSPATKLLLTTGFCGGFTTFSTFMNECGALSRNGNLPMMAIYMFASLAVGFIALIAGNYVVNCISE